MLPACYAIVATPERQRPLVARVWLAWCVSAAAHASAIGVLSALGAEALTTPPLVNADTVVLSLQATFAAPAPAPPTVEEQAVELSASVLVAPEHATIDDERFVPQAAPDARLFDADDQPLSRTTEALPPAAPSGAPGRTEALPQTATPSTSAPERLASALPESMAQPASSASVGTRPDRAPQSIFNFPPVYPEQARREGRQGTVRLRLQIDAAGRVTLVEIARSSGHPILDGAAQRAVSTWRFEPAVRGGQPVAVTVTLPVRFVLE
jgi:TonB family protein